MQTTVNKVQTAFRIEEGLLRRAKLRAKREKRSLNSLVEEALERMVPAELEWPKIKIPKEISPEILALRLPEGEWWTEEEIAADDRLAHILGVR
jgi:hypothetical protein